MQLILRSTDLNTLHVKILSTLDASTNFAPGHTILRQDMRMEDSRSDGRYISGVSRIVDRDREAV